MPNIDIIIAVGIGLSLLLFGIYFRKKISKINKNGIEVEGIVFDTVQSDSMRSSANYPIIRFVTLEKEWITEEYNISTIPGVLKEGQKVKVIYNSNNPKEFYIKSKIISTIPVLAFALAILIILAEAYKVLHIKF